MTLTGERVVQALTLPDYNGISVPNKPNAAATLCATEQPVPPVSGMREPPGTRQFRHRQLGRVSPNNRRCVLDYRWVERRWLGSQN